MIHGNGDARPGTVSKYRLDSYFGVCIMFEDVFKKDAKLTTAVTTARKKTRASTPGGAPLKTSAQASSDMSEDELRAWRDKILAAKSDDAALLQLAHQAPSVELKLAALQALTQEDSFKQAMREFRDQDKRLYRAARSRWQAASGKRVAISEARVLIAGARALFDQESIPANRVVELDRAWAALNAGLLDAALPDEFAALREQLATKVRARGEGGQAVARWLVATGNAIERLRASLGGVAQGDMPPTESATLAAGLLELLGSVQATSDARCIEKTDAANRVLALASSVVQRAEFLQSLCASDAADEANEKLKIEQWRGFPEVAETELQTILARRFADWRNAGTGERQREHAARRAHEHELGAEQRKLGLSSIQRDVEAAEAAHAAGNTAELTRLMKVIDRALKPGPVNAALTRRIESLRREQKRLRGWQLWGGKQGREQLVTEAQVLAGSAAGKVAVKAHAEAIDKLRERWKELDKLGGATNQTLWLNFDGALKAAYAPVAVHLDKLKVARNENLVARNQIVDALIQAAAKFFPVEQQVAAPSPDAGSDWRAIARALEEAQTAWRKLGPVEHTVPRKAQQGENAVTIRYAQAAQALEAPLKEAYRQAIQQREQLIAAAKNLVGPEAAARDVLDKVRALQSQWQANARALTLPRRDENKLWTAFKTATDAIFAARDAARAAKETEFSAKIKAREEIIERLTALPPASTAPEIKRAMAEADTAWRAAAEVPRPQATKLDARYRAARDATTKRLGELAVHAAQARFDALIAKMALCHEREVATDSGRDIAAERATDLDARWNAVENLPDAWKAKLEARFRGGGASRLDPQPGPQSSAPPGSKSGNQSSEGLPDILLNLEVACGIESPDECLAARQHLKLRALKNSMEGRQATATTPADIERWLLDAAATPRPDEVSRERLAKVIAAVRLRQSR
jgi:exonuclease SbcC